MAQRQMFSKVPGLFVFRDYFFDTQCAAITRETLELYKRLEAAAPSEESKLANIPQPEFVRSAHHNLPSEEYYVRVALNEPSGRQLHCEYFPRYGEDGHALGYFRGNGNLPDFVVDGFLNSVRSSMEEIALIESEQELTWKLTVNAYKSVDGAVAGFPFHVDIPANGVVTMILNVQREANFQITNGEHLEEIQLPVGALLVLSGESRYDWKHRVSPMLSKETQPSDKSSITVAERVSLVLGFQPK